MKIKLSFVNKGEPFELPILNVEMHQKWLEEMSKVEKKEKNQKKLDMIGTEVLILNVLKQVDNSVTRECIRKNMHASDFVKLSQIIWKNGRMITEGEEEDFQIS